MSNFPHQLAKICSPVPFGSLGRRLFRFKTRALIAGFCIFWSTSAMAQVTGEFYLEKTTFAPGEPVFLYFKLSNEGPDTVQVSTADPEQPFCSGNSITVTSDPAPASSCRNFRDSGCVTNGLRSLAPLLPGHSKIERYLLNFNHEINSPGSYWVEAAHIGVQNRKAQDIHSKLYFRVDGNAAAFPASEFQPWVDQLQSPQQEKRLEAARTLASLAPLSLQATLLGFADNPEFRRYAPLAFHRLNTRRSIRAMADLMKASAPGTFEHSEAARYLAETNDQRWYPLLLDAAEKNAQISEYPDYAAELGGDKMLPVLVALAKTPDSRLQAVMAMGSTGSRQAIPTLVEFLKSPDIGTSDRASYSLGLLTHRTTGQDSENRNQQVEYIKWSDWWQREGATAPIYKDTECGEMVPLP